MNERIRELAREAGITTNLDTDYFEKDVNKWIDYFSEKFAELIMKECAEVARETRWAAPPSQEQIARGILQHFGVEE